MTREEVLEMAEKAGIGRKKSTYGASNFDLQKFARLIAEHEREACAKVVEEWLHGDWHNQGVVAAAMIRARGEK